MARGGARPGTGPKVGSKNKKTVEREMQLAKTQALVLATVEQQRQAAAAMGRKRAKDVLDELMHIGLGLASSYQAQLPDGTVNKAADETRFWQAINFARECARDLVGFQDPKFKAVATYAVPTTPPAEAPKPAAGGKVVAQIGDPARVYRQMIGGARG